SRAVQIAITSALRGMARLISTWSSAPEIPEPIGRQLGIADRVLDVLVPEVVLQGSSVVAVIGQLEAAGVAQHVGMDCKRHLGGLAELHHEMVEAHRADGPTALRDEYVGLCRVFTP